MSRMAELAHEKEIEDQINDGMIAQCILDHVTDDIMRISRYIDFLVDDINYLTDTDNTLNIDDFDLSFDLHRIQKLFINFKDKYKGELRL